METLMAKSMVKNRKLAKAISDAAWVKLHGSWSIKRGGTAGR
jgi:hypothetical protein